jgi:very-short-patch-repair endonuclease
MREKARNKQGGVVSIEGKFKGEKIRILRQRPIDNFIVDFYISKLKLVIEID